MLENSYTSSRHGATIVIIHSHVSACDKFIIPSPYSSVLVSSSKLLRVISGSLAAKCPTVLTSETLNLSALRRALYSGCVCWKQLPAVSENEADESAESENNERGQKKKKAPKGGCELQSSDNSPPPQATPFTLQIVYWSIAIIRILISAALRLGRLCLWERVRESQSECWELSRKRAQS